jgi:acetyltransferase-like isoleucine patch superfamily enzyme
MAPTVKSWPLSRRLKAQFQRVLQTRLWGMDIHPTALIAPSALIDRTWPRGIHIGAQCQIGEEAVVLTHDMTRGIYYDTRIGDRTVLGARSIVMPGLTIGEDCVVMPGALVTKDMPPSTVATGNPAKISPRAEGTMMAGQGSA